jgi:uncharacterized protein YbjT (DUF2867 family)
VRVLLFGATGMVGQGVLRECLLDPAVEAVVTVGRTATGVQDPKLREVVRQDITDLEGALAAPFDACFFCLGVSSAGMGEAEYERITYSMTMAVADRLSRVSPSLTFIYVSGAGTDSSERGRIMWARVKGRTENALLGLLFGAYIFRPGVIVPLHGIRSKTALYRAFYAVLKPVLPLLRRALPNHVLTTEDIGRAMLAVAREGAPKRVLESRDIRAVLSH